MLWRNWRQGITAGPASGVDHTAGSADLAAGGSQPGVHSAGPFPLGWGVALREGSWLGRMLPWGACRDVVERAEHLCLLVLLRHPCCFPLGCRKVNALF